MKEEGADCKESVQGRCRCTGENQGLPDRGRGVGEGWQGGRGAEAAVRPRWRSWSLRLDCKERLRMLDIDKTTLTFSHLLANVVLKRDRIIKKPHKI